ncbi:dipeptidase [Kyrpidia spormannii]|uniref:Dipeptidase n=1 Tax=Kyrpidia spormannii TaxID=2055160 RepID=A0A6F9EGW7_9BACL|nr:dipeptidase [Kyrpidia spormannii]CAB3395665.1 Dipeptidase [Kyrpidia spormannii]
MNNGIDAAIRYAEAENERFLEELKAFIRIPSISALSEHKGDVLAAARWLVDALTRAGAHGARLVETAGNPVVYGEWMGKPGAPTALIYGHYDVQPVDPLNLWQSPPFEPEVRDGKIYGRGTSDDKGQVFMHVKAVEAWLKTVGELPVNVKFCFEGEEEVGSGSLPGCLEANRDLFQADVLVISDTSMLAPGRPAICYGLRGMAALQVDVYGAKGDLHSGIYGGGVPNPIHALVEILASMHGPDGRVRVEGFYDRVRELTPEEREAIRELGFDEEALARDLGLTALVGEAGYNYVERTTARPTLEINGIYGGFQGEGTKTVIPAEAHAKITCRLVPDQEPGEIMDLIAAHVSRHAPVGVRVEVRRFDGGRPYVAPLDHPGIQAAIPAYEAVYGTGPVFTRLGGSIPIVEEFHRILGLTAVMMGFSLPTENNHAPNEHFDLENFKKGIQTLCVYWNELARRGLSEAAGT